MTGQDKLKCMIKFLPAWRKTHRTDKQCLHAMQDVATKCGLTLPMNQGSALNCFYTLNMNAEQYGWKHIHHPIAGYALVFHKKVGWIPAWGKYAGHISILYGGVLYGNKNWKNSPTWEKNLIGAFVPVDKPKGK